MTEWSSPDRSRSRAVLIGTSTYSELPGVPAAANSLARMQRLLTGPLCLWPTSQVTLVPDQRLPGDLPDRLIDLYKQATDVALFYYVGHGQIDDEGQLCLGLVDSRRLETERRATTSLTFDAVRRALRASPASIKVIILDCCFAGQAVHGPRHPGRAGGGCSRPDQRHRRLYPGRDRPVQHRLVRKRPGHPHPAHLLHQAIRRDR